MADYRSDKQKAEDEANQKAADRRARVHDRSLHYVKLALALNNEADLAIESDALVRAGKALQRLRGGSHRDEDE